MRIISLRTEMGKWPVIEKMTRQELIGFQDSANFDIKTHYPKILGRARELGLKSTDIETPKEKDLLKRMGIR